ncbi:phage tail assembly protein T, partial [Escherichia coli]|nr:phage tail assembly protein T [Escherichia coli]
MHTSDFSRIVPGPEEEQVDGTVDDTMLMEKSAGRAGGEQIVGEEGREILACADVAGVGGRKLVLLSASGGILWGVLT